MPGRPLLSDTRAREAARKWLPLIVGLAVGVRLALGWMHPFLFPDSADYEALARAIVAHQPYAVGGNIATRMPGYPIFVAMVYFLGGSVRAVLVMQAMMGGGIVLLTYRLGAYISRGVGLLAALLAAVDPLSVGFSAALLTETPFTLCLMASLCLCLRIAEATKVGRLWGMWVLLGVLWGIGVYFRASALWCIVPLAIWGVSVMRGRPMALRLGMGGGAVVIVFVLLMPWLVRNYRHFHSGPIRLTTLEGISLYEAVYPGADGGPKQDKIALPAEMEKLDEAQRNDEWARRGWEYVKNDPGRVSKLAIAKAGRTWSPWMNAAEFQSRPIQWGMTLWYVPLFLLAGVGIYRGMTWDRKLLLLIPLVYFTAVHALFLGSVRYRVPLMPVVCLFAAAGIFWLLNGIGGKRSPV